MEIVGNVWQQTKDCNVSLPVEAHQSLEEIKKIILSIVDLMKVLEKQGVFQRYAKAHINKKPKLLDEAIHRFSVNFAADLFSLSAHNKLPGGQLNMQIGVLCKQLCIMGALIEFDGISQEWHDKILVTVQMSKKEGENRGEQAPQLIRLTIY
ncbi:hypothetical protein L208DRAFT_1377006 [Tricholoma matsutake]|nr:hypothetical protein L208DRAFT_1377006 [Tricholoma matsutake 945]